MMSQEIRELERKVISILKILSDSQEPVGARFIASRLKDYGVYLSERGVRYHLLLLDERGLTRNLGRRDGRLITQSGINELHNALVSDRVGSAMAKIQTITCQTTFESEGLVGNVPFNVSLFAADKFKQAHQVMTNIYGDRSFLSDLVAIAGEGDRLGEVRVLKGEIGLATISGIIIGSILLRSGVPLDFKFAGMLQISNNKCVRFSDLISFNGSSLDPSEIFLASKMTSVSGVVREGSGKIIASFCEFPALALSKVELVIKQLETAGIIGLYKIGGVSEMVCETPVGVSRVGMIVADGLNLVAVAEEAGIEMEHHAMSGVMDFKKFRGLQDLYGTWKKSTVVG